MGVIRASELLKERYVALPLSKSYKQILGKLPREKKWNMLLHGIAGSGKSTYSLVLALELASFGNTLYGNFEEALGPTLQNKISTVMKKYSNKNFSKIRFLADNTVDSFWTELSKNPYKYCIVDSVSHIAATPKKILEFWNKSSEYPNTSFIFISHAKKTKDGKRESDYKGTSAIGHLVDINQRVVDGVVWNDKNRFLGMDCTKAPGYNIFSKQLVLRWI